MRVNDKTHVFIHTSLYCIFSHHISDDAIITNRGGVVTGAVFKIYDFQNVTLPHF